MKTHRPTYRHITTGKIYAELEMFAEVQRQYIACADHCAMPNILAQFEQLPDESEDENESANPVKKCG